IAGAQGNRGRAVGGPERNGSRGARRRAGARRHRHPRIRAESVADMELANVRRRVRAAVEQARRDAAERRANRDAAFRDYETFLAATAIPSFRVFAAALIAEGHPYSVQTPAGSVRLSSDHAGGSFIELALDDTGAQPVVVGRTT